MVTMRGARVYRRIVETQAAFAHSDNLVESGVYSRASGLPHAAVRGDVRRKWKLRRRRWAPRLECRLHRDVTAELQ
jgi:hypothetical protein